MGKFQEVAIKLKIPTKKIQYPWDSGYQSVSFRTITKCLAIQSMSRHCLGSLGSGQGHSFPGPLIKI